MTELADRNYQIAMFMEVSGLDYETASLTLSIHNYNLEQAINFHLERSLNENDDANVSTASSSGTSAAVAPQNGTSSAASTSTSTSTSGSTSQRQDATASVAPSAIPLNEDDNVRAPIPPKREQMILPDEDNFRFRKRRVQPPRSVCPLRNFELEGRLQEARIQAAVRRNFVSNSLGDAEEDEDNDGTFRFAAIPTAPTQKAATSISSDIDAPVQSFRSKLTASKLGQGMPSRLSDLYRPPVDISFCGSFQAARDYAKEQNRWLIVNVQDNSDFNCQVLNRDIWSNEKLREAMKRFFVFWQVAIDNSDGHRYQVFYGINVFPYVGIIDPRTGEEKFSYKNGFKRTVNEFLQELQDYLKANTAHPSMELAVTENNLIADVDFLSATNDSKKATSTREADTSDSPVKSKRRKLAMEPSSLSEQEQIALAIGNSLREVGSDGGGAGDSGDDASDITDDDDDVEFDFGSYSDDERSTHSSVAKEPQSQPKVDEVVEENGKPVDGADTYECYLGNENDPKARIQLRLPDGNRHILEWPCSTQMKALKLYIPFKYPELTADSPYKVICPFGSIGGASQPSNVLDLDDTLTLKEASLYPTVILHLRNDD